MDGQITERIIRVLARAAANEGMLPTCGSSACSSARCRSPSATARWRRRVRSLGDVRVGGLRRAALATTACRASSFS